MIWHLDEYDDWDDDDFNWFWDAFDFGIDDDDIDGEWLIRHGGGTDADVEAWRKEQEQGEPA